MSPFWAGIFENLQGRGRHAALFILVLPGLLGAALIATHLQPETYRDFILPALSGLGAVVLVGLGRELFRARARRRDRLSRAPLSADELNKARRKLVRPPPILNRPGP